MNILMPQRQKETRENKNPPNLKRLAGFFGDQQERTSPVNPWLGVKVGVSVSAVLGKIESLKLLLGSDP